MTLMGRAFDIELVLETGRKWAARVQAAVAGEEDEIALLDSICKVLQDEEACVFHMSGFGQPHWPVRVRPDLCIVLEQLPDVLNFTANSTPNVTLHMYEQGIERLLEFERTAGGVLITCRSGTDWKPSPPLEMADSVVLHEMLVRFAQRFISLASTLASDLMQTEAFLRWQRRSNTLDVIAAKAHSPE